MRVIRVLVIPLLVVLLPLLAFRLAWMERLVPTTLSWVGIQQARLDLHSWNWQEIRIDSLHLALDHAPGPVSITVTDAVLRYRLADLLRGQLAEVTATTVAISLPTAGVERNQSFAGGTPDPKSLVDALHLRHLPARQLHLPRLSVDFGPLASTNPLVLSVTLRSSDNESRLNIVTVGKEKTPPLAVDLHRTEAGLNGSLFLDWQRLREFLPPSMTAALPDQGRIEATLRSTADSPLRLACSLSGLRHQWFSAENLSFHMISAQPLSARSLTVAPASRLTARAVQGQGFAVAALEAGLGGSLAMDDDGLRLHLAPPAPWSVSGLTMGSLRLAPLHLANLALHLELDRSGLRAVCTLTPPGGRGTLRAECTQAGEDTRKGQCTVRSEGLQMDADRNPLALLVEPKLPLALHQGTLTFSLQGRWQPGAPLALDLELDGKVARGTAFAAPFSGLVVQQRLHLLPALRSITAGLVQLDKLEGPIPVDQLTMHTRFTAPAGGQAPVVAIERADAALFNGKIRLANCVYDRGNPDTACLVRLDDLDLQPIVALQKVDGLTVTGRVSGQLPLRFSPQGVRIHQGRVENIGSGLIRYHPAGNTLEGSPLTVYARNALEELHYQRLTAHIDYLPDGTLTVALHLQGQNPKLEGGRAVHLNLNTEQNLLSLLKSLQYSHSLSSELNRTIRQHR